MFLTSYMCTHDFREYLQSTLRYNIMASDGLAEYSWGDVSLFIKSDRHA